MEPIRTTALPPYMVGSTKMTEIFVKFLPDHTPFVWREAGRYEKPTHTLDGRHIVAVGLPAAPSPAHMSTPQYINRLTNWIPALDNTELLLYRQIYFERWAWRTGHRDDYLVYMALDRAYTRRQQPEYPRHLKVTWVQ